MRVLALDYGSARCGCAVSDPTGAAIPNAKITITEVATNLSYSVTSSAARKAG